MKIDRKKLRLATGSMLTGVALVFTLTSFVSCSSSESKKCQRKPPSFNHLLEKMDSNNDGKLSKEEIKGPLAKDFDVIDTNEDGFITEEEFKNAPKPERPAK